MIAAVDRRMSGGCQRSFEESSEEALSVLPRHTKVVVTGNNRTKSVLVGLHGVVKKAVGLGGWHWLVLTNGIEVKLQRNALSVIEAPTGQEDDDYDEFNNMKWNDVDMACDSTQFPKIQRSRNKHPKGSSNKSLSRSHSSDSHSKGSVLSTSWTTNLQMSHVVITLLVQKIDLSKLETTALWRYSRHFNLVGESPSPSKEQLIEIVQKHFMSQQLDELQVIVGFVHAAKRLKFVCD